MVILGNLDCEARWGGQTLPLRVRRRISAAAALLGALAPEGEPAEVWVPAAIDPQRIQLPGVTLREGTPPRWDLAWADPTAKDANDRHLALAVRAQIGAELGGTLVATRIAELDDLRGPWVAKAPWTAAGRDRAHGDGPPHGELRVYTERLIQRFGAVIVEPWLERIVDVGVCVAADGRAHAPHTLKSDPRGTFVGIDLAAPPLEPPERTQLDRAVEAARAALAARGYTGPFTVDAFAYTQDGERRFHPICEINARHSFGHVAHALHARHGTTILGFGTPPAGARTFVAPGEHDPVTAWGA